MQHILVTGSNRSGTTWIGSMLSLDKKVDNIIEPLNPNRIKRFGKHKLNFWYPALHEVSQGSTADEVSRIVLDYIETSWFSVIKNAFNSYEGHNLYKSLKIRGRRASKPIKLLKDPTALFCVPFLVKHFQVIPIIIIRHPAAYALSIKEKNWWFDFDNLLKQPDFFSGILAEFREETIAFQQEADSKSIIENAALFWKIAYAQVQEYQVQFPDWHYIIHEEAANMPFETFKKLYKILGLNFNEDVVSGIRNATQAPSNESSRLRRDSKMVVEKWKSKLTKVEVDTIYKLTHSVSKTFYCEDSWKYNP